MEFLKASTPLIIGLLAAYIALQQWLTARHKLKMELFDRRFKIYQAAQELMGEMAKDANPNLAMIQKFKELLPEARFLFHLVDASVLQRLVDTALAMRKNTQELDRAIRYQDQSDMLSEEDRRLLESVGQLEIMLPILFARYLDLHKV